MSDTTRPTRTWRFPRPLIQDHIEFALLLWGVLLAVSYAITGGIAYFSDVDTSVWEQSSNAAMWYMAVICGWVCYTVVPMFIANGKTRRDTGIEAAIFTALLTVAVSLMVTAGYLIEYLVYGIAGWPRRLSGSHLFDSHLDIGMIALENLLILIVRGAVGAFVGLSAYRWDGSGWLALAPASVLIGIIGAVTRDFSGPAAFVIVRIIEPDTPSIWLALTASLISLGVSIATGWWALRAMPLRNR